MKGIKEKSKKICEVKPHIMEGCMLLSFSVMWIKLFQCIPTFEMFIDEKGRVVLISKQKVITK